MNAQLRDVLLGAYAPCAAFDGSCHRMRWSPQQGHVPRGFCGATGALEDVGLVMVFAEPGDPHVGEQHEGEPEEILNSAYLYAYESFKSGRDQFHRNVRKLLDLCWPDMVFEEQMQRTWMTDSVLCSAERECGAVPSSVARECRNLYLIKQLALFPRAVVVAFGGKARERMRGIPGVLTAHAVAPPGANAPAARESWVKVAEAVRAAIALRNGTGVLLDRK